MINGRNFLIVSHLFYPAIDGASQVFTNLAKELKRKGGNVWVIASNRRITDDFINPKAKALPAKGKLEGIKVSRIGVFARGRRIFKLARLLTGWDVWRVLEFGPVFSSLLWLLTNKKINWVITGPFPTAAIVWGWLAARRFGAKLAVLPCFHFEEPGHQNKFLLRLTKSADLVLCLTKTEAAVWQKLGVKKTQLVPGRILLNQFLLDWKPQNAGNFPQPPVVLFLGTKAAHKRVDLVIEAIKLLNKKGAKAKLIIAGPETLWSREYLAERKLPSFVEWLGKVDESQKAQLLDRAWCLVNPSEFESLGLVFLEAWARKKPVIGAKIPVLEEVINDNQDGLLFQKNNLNDLVAKIKIVLSDKKLARRMGENGYKKLLHLANF